MVLSQKAKALGDSPYFPTHPLQDATSEGQVFCDSSSMNFGITIRQHLIETFMAAIVSNPGIIDEIKDTTVKWLNEGAHQLADGTLEAMVEVQP